MQSHLHEELTLDDLASVACLSPAHFNRIFRRLIGVPPVEYLTALRFQQARQLLLMTSLRITDICYEVGYTSTGSFTSRFTQFVGLSPRQLRQRAQAFEPGYGTLADQRPLEIAHAPGRRHLIGRIDAPDTFQGTIYVGLFSSPIPQGRPARCARLDAPGQYLLPNVADGVYYLRAAAFPHATNPLASLLPTEKLLLGNDPGPLLIHHGQVVGNPDLVLHSPRISDPPLVLGLPLL
ncbi:MAG TPA: helix-turn-helix transcriptional regulator [Ktedonobacterales bacterium]|nr:helix-turn-helix transcriptional regulator [Ktedonobacterales bacterium]